MNQEEQLESVIIGLRTIYDLTKKEKHSLLCAIAQTELTGKFISTTIFEKDKQKITDVYFDVNNVNFSFYIRTDKSNFLINLDTIEALLVNGGYESPDEDKSVTFYLVK